MAETYSVVRQIVVEGAVQGVGYREFTRRAALQTRRFRLGAQPVRRRRRGAPPRFAAEVEAIIAEMRQGPRLATVRSIGVTGRDETAGDDSGTFIVAPTE